MTATSSLPAGEGPRLLLTVPDAAAALSISRSKLYELLAAGLIRSVRIDGSRRIPLLALETYVESLLAREATMPRLRDGVIKRGQSWSYVIRVPDPATGVTKPRWVGGFNTEQEAKAARDEARVQARRGEYVNRSTLTVADYLAQWLEAHATTVKPKTFAGYRHDIDHYIVPESGGCGSSPCGQR